MGRIKYLHLKNFSDTEVTIDRGPTLGWIMAADMVPRYPGYVSVGSRRYNAWQTLAFEATTERKEEVLPANAEPLVDRPTYPLPKKVLSWPTSNNVSKDSTIQDEKVVSRVNPLPRVINKIEEKGGGDRVPESR